MHCTSSRSIGRVCTGYSQSLGLTALLTIATCCMCVQWTSLSLLWAWALQKRVKYLDTSCVRLHVCECVCTSAGPIFINCVILALDMFGLYPTLQASFTRLFSVDTGACSVLFCCVVLSACLCHSVYYLFALQCSRAAIARQNMPINMCVYYAKQNPIAKPTENPKNNKRTLKSFLSSTFAMKFGNVVRVD